MASNIKRPIQIFNGTDWDKILPEISEDMIKSGWTQSNNSAASYKVLPGGIVVSWGLVLATANSGGTLDHVITLPIAPNPNSQHYIDARLYSAGDQWNASMLDVHAVKYSATQLRFVVPNGLRGNSGYELHWFCVYYL